MARATKRVSTQRRRASRTQRRTRPDKFAAFAATDFQPIPGKPDAQFLPEQRLLDIGVWCRVANLLMFKTKDELADLAEQMNGEKFHAMMGSLFATQQRLKEFAALVEQCHLRLMVSVAHGLQRAA